MIQMFLVQDPTAGLSCGVLVVGVTRFVATDNVPVAETLKETHLLAYSGELRRSHEQCSEFLRTCCCI